MGLSELAAFADSVVLFGLAVLQRPGVGQFAGVGAQCLATAPADREHAVPTFVVAVR